MTLSGHSYVVSNGRMTDEVERIWKEAVTAQVAVLSLNLPVKAKDTTKGPQSQ
jgi:hypothetical protein